MRKLGLARGESRLSPRIRNGSATWEQLVFRFTNVIRTEETYDEYLSFPPDQRAAIKDVGFFVGGRFSRERRRRDELLGRSLLSFDLDHLDAFEDPIEFVLEGYPGRELALHTTHTHGPELPRLRLVLPLTRDLEAQEYEPVARMVASLLGMDVFDDTTFQCSRIMYWPSASKDGEFRSHHQEGVWTDPDDILALYEDPADFGSWPTSSRVGALSPPVDHARDPTEAPGAIGAFNRCFDIHSVIHRWELPYEPTMWDNRYMPHGSSGAPGAIVYDDVFMYSWHESDPAGLQNLNAFDLVRVHKFGGYTADEVRDEVPTTQRASMKAMLAEAMMLTEVREMIARGEMPDLDAEELLTQARAADEGKRTKQQTSRLTFDELREEIEAINPSKAKLDQLVIKVAAAKLDPVDTDILAAVLREHWTDPPPKKDTILKQIQTQAKRLTGDLANDGTLGDRERELIEAMLTEHFGSGALIKRIGRRFWSCEHGHWALIDDEMIRGKLNLTLTRLREQRPEELMELVATVGDSKTSALAASLWEMVKAHLAERESRDDPLQLKRHIPLPVVNCATCELWFDEHGDMGVEPHDPAHFWTTQIATSFDPDATCPEWDRFVTMIASGGVDPEDVVRHIEELGGYVISMSRWLKTWVLFHGATDTGKTTLCDVFAELLGSAALSTSLGRFAKGYDFAEQSLIGKQVLMDDDFARDDSLPDGFMKKISEEKTMTADIKYGDAIAFLCRAFPLVCANHWPVTRDVSDAFRERALVFDFLHRIEGDEKSDQRKAKMLRDEMPGILNRFLAGLARLRARGTWDIPIDCAIAHEKWVSGSNAVMLFIDDMMTRESEGFVRRSQAWMRYRTWQRDVGGEMMKRQTLFERLDQILGPAGKRVGHWGWYGWTLGASTGEMDDLDD